MDVLVVCKGDIAGIPPVMTYLLSLIKLDKKVYFICGSIDSKTEQYLKDETGENLIIDNKNITRFDNKIIQWIYFRNEINKHLAKTHYDFIWLATFDTAMCVYRDDHFKRSRVILSVLELYDSAHHIYRKALKKLLPKAYKVVVPEYNRACILRTWYGLNETPIVLPNKPFDIKLPEISINDNNEIYKQIEKIKNAATGKRILLYQGLISKYRNLSEITKIAEKHKEELVLVLMGKDFDYLQELTSINDSIIHVPFIPSPYHLYITNVCDIGIVTYDFIDLNNIYCAPNKIWEYSAFSKPMIGNSIPGLQYTIEYNKAGVCVDMMDTSSIEKGLDTLLENYTEYSQASFKYYNSINLIDNINDFLI